MLGTVAGVLGTAARVPGTAAGVSGMVFILQTSIIDDKQLAILVVRTFSCLEKL